MTIRKKSNEELQSQVELFLKYEKGKRKIDEEKSKELFDILLNKETISASKEQTKEQLVGVLNTEEFDGLYEDYCEWLEKSNKVRKNILEKILPKEYLFLSNENYLKNYFLIYESKNVDIEYYRNLIEKNIGILKKYNIEDKDLKLLITLVPSGYSENIDKNLKLFYDNGITDINDLCLLKDGMMRRSDWIEENIKSLNMLGIIDPKDLVKLKKIVFSKNPKSTKINLEILKNVGITNVDDLVELQEIIVAGGNKIITSWPRIERKDTSEDISRCLKFLTENGVVLPNDLKLLKAIILAGKLDNMKMLTDSKINSPSDLKSFENIIIQGRTEILELLKKENIIRNTHDLRLLENIICKGDTGVFSAIINCGVRKIDDLLKIKDIITSYYKSEEIKAKIEALKSCGITGADDLLKFKDIITGYYKSEEIKAKIEALKSCGITGADDLLKFKDIITGDYKSEEIKAKIEALKSCGITGAKDLLKFKDIITGYYKSEEIKGKIEALKSYGITGADDLLKFKDIITGYCKSEEIKGKIEALKSCGITGADDLLKFKDIITSYYKPEEIKAKIEALKSCGITRTDDLLKLKDIITSYYESEEIKGKIEVLQNFGITLVDDLIKLKDIITSDEESDLIKREFDILFNEWNIKNPVELSKFQQAILYENISKFKEYFGNTKQEELGESEMKVLSGIRLPENLEFEVSNHKGYLKFIAEIVDTTYNYDKKIKIIKKIVTLGFSEAEKYLEVFRMLDTSISMDVQRIKNELIDEILEVDNPSEVAEQIKNIFEKNNLPLTGKVFKVFELLYPKEKFDLTLRPASGMGTLGSPVLNNYKDEGKNVYRLIYKDLLNIAIKSGDRSLKEYLNTFIGSEALLKKFEGIVGTSGFNSDDKQCLKGISYDEKEQLRYLFKKIARLSNMFLGKELKEWSQEKVSDEELLNFYKEIKKGFNLRKGKSIYERIQTLLYVNGLKYHSAKEVLSQMNESKKQAHEHGLKLYNESNGGKIDFPKHAFLKGVTEDTFSKIINRGVTSREYLGGGDDGNAAGSDCTPFDIDGWYADSFLEGGYGGIKLVVDIDKNNIFNTGEKGITGYDENQYELFKTGALRENHYGIRTGIPTTEIDYIIYTGNFESKDFETMCYEIARNGYYIPITDKEGNIKFKPKMYHNIRKGFNYMQYYDGFDVEQVNGKWVSKESDNKINKGYSGTNDKITEDGLRKLISDNSPGNEKYSGFAKENRELVENTIEWIKEILENQCGIKFNSKHDTSITGAELHDSGSTGRGTDIPTKDVDLDFTLLLDANDYNEKLELIIETIYRETGTLDKEGEGKRTGGFQMKSKKNKIGQGPERPDGISLDLLILKKSQVIDYSSSDAMKEKLDYINDNLGEEDLDRVRTNVIIMKKLLKSQNCYKKTSTEGGIAGIGVENWITQHHGSFIEALESFEKVAYGGEYEPGKQPVSLEIFKEEYPIYDAGENYKDGCNDNFVDKINEHGYNGMLNIVIALRTKGIEGIEELIKEYEKNKKEYTG